MEEKDLEVSQTTENIQPVASVEETQEQRELDFKSEYQDAKTRVSIKILRVYFTIAIPIVLLSLLGGLNLASLIIIVNIVAGIWIVIPIYFIWCAIIKSDLKEKYFGNRGGS